MRNLAAQSTNYFGNQYFSSISRIISYYSIDKIVYQLIQIGSSETSILADTIPLTDLEVLHKRKELESILEKISFLGDDDYFKNKGGLESRSERKLNNSIIQDRSRSLSLINQYQSMKVSRPERSNVNTLQVISSQNTQSTLLRDRYYSVKSNSVNEINPSLGIKFLPSNLTSAVGISIPINQVRQSFFPQSLSLEKISFDKPESQQSNFSVMKERKSFVSEIQIVRPQIVNENAKSSGFNKGSISATRPEKSTISSQDRQKKVDEIISSAMEVNKDDLKKARENTRGGSILGPESDEISRQRLISDFVNKPYSYSEFPEAIRLKKEITDRFIRNDQQHVIGGEFFTRRYGEYVARSLGIANEFFGGINDLIEVAKDLLLDPKKDFLSDPKYERIFNEFEIKDLIDNEIGIGIAGGQDYSREIFEFVKANPILSRIYSKEMASNPFKHYAVENQGKYGLGISRPTERPSERYSLGISSPTATPTDRYNLGVNLPSRSSQQTNKTPVQGNTNTSSKQETNQGNERDRSQGAGGRDAGQRERNRESGHKGYGGPQ